MFLHDNISIDFYYYNVTRSFLKFPIKCGKKKKEKEKKYVRIFKKNMKLIFDKAYQFLNVIIINNVMITNRKKKENDRRLDNIYSYIVCL